MKKNGSILIEVVAASAILLMTTTFVVSTCIQSKKILKERRLNEEVTRTVCNLINEFKYNVSKDDIEQMLTDSNNEICIKYSKGLSNILIDKDIKNLERGDGISIRKVDEDEMGLKLCIVARVRDGENEVNIEKEFTKSWWMDKE